MEEIKVGEYIRTVAGYIGKIINFNDGMYTAQMKDTTIDLYIDDIKNHKEKIIDLIEEGDYVNGYKVIDALENLETGELHLEMPMDYTNEELGDCTIYNKDIKDVVTKEQFDSRKYVVGDESNE